MTSGSGTVCLGLPFLSLLQRHSRSIRVFAVGDEEIDMGGGQGGGRVGEEFSGLFRLCPGPPSELSRAEIELWRVDYNCQRPHSSLRYETPKAFGDRARCQLPPSAGATAVLIGVQPETPGQQATCQNAGERGEVN